MTIDLDSPTIVSLILTELAEPGDKEMSDLLDEHDDTAAGRRAALNAILNPEDTIVSSAARARWTPRLPQESRINSMLEKIERLGMAVISQGDPRYPAWLYRLRAKPTTLYAVGDAEVLRAENKLAIVGARAATSYGDHIALEFAAAASNAGYTTVSGGAYGIDAAVHRSSIASGHKTIAVMAGGVDRFYPMGNLDLLQRVTEHGVVISELSPGQSPTRHRFLERNRIIGAISDGLLVVEAGFRSGSIGAAERAAGIDVPVFAVPGPVTSAASAGTNRLIREGIARPVSNWTELAEDLAN